MSLVISRGLVLLGFMLPLAFFPGLISLYRLPKVTLLALSTSVLCWLWLWSEIRNKEQTPFLPLFLPAAAYLVASALSLFRAINPYESSTFLFLAILGLCLFWITVSCFSLERLTTFFHWVTMAGTLVALMGIIQAWGVNIPALIPTGGPGSTFGNKNMAAQYLLFVLPVAFYLFLAAARPEDDWLYSGAAALLLTYFIYTGTRAAWGGAMMGIAAVWFLKRRASVLSRVLALGRRKVAFLTGIIVFVLAMNILPRYLVPGFSLSSPLAQLGSMIELDENPSAQGRFAIWANGLAIFRDHPLLGAGKGDFRFIYPLYARRVITDPAFSAQSRAADAHNDYVQLLAETGMAGALSFLWILFLLARRLWTRLRALSNPGVVPVIFGLVAILAEAFWDFPFNLPVPIAFFWIYAGLLWQLTADQGPQKTPQAQWSQARVVSVASLALVATLYSIASLSSLRGDYLYSRGARAFEKDRFEEAERYLEQAAGTSPLNYRYHFLYGLLLLKKRDFPQAALAIRRSLRLNPYNINALNNLGIAHASMGNYDKSIQAFETALKIWPDHMEAHNNLGMIHARLGNNSKAIRHFQTVLGLDPKHTLALNALKALEAGTAGAP